jgi:hypothetical protein
MVKLSKDMFEKTNLLAIAIEQGIKDKKYINQLIENINKQFVEDVHCHRINRIQDARCVADVVKDITLLAQKTLL